MKTFRILIEKRMVNDCWILCVFGIITVFVMQYVYRIVKAFRISLGKNIMNDYWTAYVFGMESVFGM